MFKVVINEIVEVEENVKTYERLHDKKEFDTEKDPQFAYLTTEKMVKKEIQVLAQTVETLDLVKVIKAINGIY